MTAEVSLDYYLLSCSLSRSYWKVKLVIEWGVFGNLCTIWRVLQPSISTRLSADKGRALIQIMKKKNLSIRLWTVVCEPGGAKSTTLITRDLFGGGDSIESGWEKRLDLRNIFCKCQFFCLCHEIIERFLFKIMIFSSFCFLQFLSVGASTDLLWNPLFGFWENVEIENESLKRLRFTST